MENEMKKHQKHLLAARIFLAAFFLWTVLVRCFDVQPIGPEGTSIGFVRLNRCIHHLTGVHWALYTATDWLGLVPIGVCVCFGFNGLLQWIVRKQIRKVDRSLLALGGFYLLVIGVYLFFETVVINYRPVLIDGNLEASYPSSTTMLVLCVMTTAIMQIKSRMKDGWLKRCLIGLIGAFTIFMVLGRLISGVHWFTDIIGAILLSAGLIALYTAVISKIEQ